MRCVCGKKIYLSQQLAQSMGKLLNWKYGQEYDEYKCRLVPDNWHLTTQRWRRQQAACAGG